MGYILNARTTTSLRNGVNGFDWHESVQYGGPSGCGAKLPAKLIRTMDILTFSALGDASRMRIVELLIHGPLTVGEIAEHAGLRQPQASKHLRVLLECGLVEVQADANRRNYKLRLEPFQALDAWLKTYEGVWDEKLGALGHYLHKLQKQQAAENNET